MAFGIDDGLAAAAAALELTNTIVETIKRYRGKKQDLDIELLIEEVRVTALHRIDQADLALAQFERTLIEAKVNLDRSLTEVIAETPFWKPFQQHRLSQFHRSLNAFSDSIYSATDDIAALVRCRQQTTEMGAAVADSARQKHDFRRKVTEAKSLGEVLSLLRHELVRQKAQLK
jgi:hypothetical protein